MPTLEQLFILPLETAGIRYMVSGSVASIHYGEPRLTLDVDIVLALEPPQVAQLGPIFPAPEYYCPPVDVVQIETKRPQRGHFNVIHIASGLKADMYPSREHPLFAWAMSSRRRVRAAAGGLEIWLAPPEYVVLWKLAYFSEGGSEKHLRDIRSILAVSGPSMELDLIDRTAATQGLKPAWEAAILKT